MGSHVGIVRTADDLTTSLTELKQLKEKADRVKAHGASQYNAGWHEALDLGSLLTVSEAVARSALAREESRGAHTRLDFPGEREEWQKVNIIVRKGAEGMEARAEPRPDPPAALAAIAHASLEELEGERG